MNNDKKINKKALRAGKSLKDHLKHGSFFTLFEISSPLKKEDLIESKEKVMAIRDILLTHNTKTKSNTEKINSKSLISGIALLDKAQSINCYDSVEFAKDIFKEGIINILYMSGKKSTISLIKRYISKCLEYGIENIIPTTGNGYIANKDTKKAKYFDSIHSLHIIKKEFSNSGLFPGATVNPFKYIPDDLFAQYFKLIKKINYGANFIVAQSGWDMKKYQELRWYLNERDYNLPTIARLPFLTLEKVNEIQAGKHPGIFISRDLQIILEKEKEYGIQQFESAQWRRLQIQAAGCRLMGYSGIQISGLETPEQIQTALNRLKESQIEFEDFQIWKQVYEKHFSRSDMAPFEYRYYMFKNLFKKQYTNKKFIEKQGIAPCSIRKKIKYIISKKLFFNANLLAPNEHLLTKKILVKCPSCSYCRLPATHYICPETCPKGLANGPCGGSSIDGSCELNKKMQCIHHQRVELAAWLNQLDILEERYIKHPEQGEKSKI
jgi:methylenetetrahydrofolate reductase (NADPH)